ncbi:MAG: tRNA lysidine(34) synthetase TilS [Thermodesulfovibrionales bacterium]|nr:tRNA lysidine(34) synthetase TilS [Thermodesulfovibrionales bacterium]
MNLLEKVLKSIKRFEMIKQGDRLIIGLSGGPDSVCLLHVLHSLRDRFKIELIPVYVNHGLRPDEINYEIDFCKDFVKNLGYELIIKDVDVMGYVKATGENKQEAARKLRYNVLNDVLLERKAQAIALGHTADDQAETVLMRLIRGTGPQGLQGIPPVRGNIIRPLIEIERKEIEEYLFKNNLRYIIDSSNLRTEYFRNWIRLKVLPLLREKNPSIITTLTKMAEIFSEEERIYEIEVTKALMRSLSRKTDSTIELFLKPLEAMDTRLLRRLLRKAVDEIFSLRGISFVHIEDMVQLIKQGRAGDRLYIRNNIRAIKLYSTFKITSEEPVRLKEYVLPVPGSVWIEERGYKISAELSNSRPDDLGDGKTRIVIDSDRVSDVLKIRHWLPGDYFFPLGLNKKKKLQDLFVDLKIPRDERYSIPVVEDRGNIIWIVGLRMDHRYRVQDETEKFLILRIVNG